MTKTERDLHQLLYEIYKRAHYAPKQLFHLEQYLLLSDSLNISVREPVISFAREDSVKKATIDSLNKIQLTKLDEIRKKSLEDSRGQKNILRYFIAGALLLLVVFGFLLLRKKTAEPFPHQPSEKVNSNKVDLAGAREAAAFFNKAFSTEDQILDAGFTDYFIIHEPVETPGKAFYFAAEVKKLREGKMVFEKGQSASGTSNSLIFATGLYEKTSLSGSLRSMFTLFLLKEAVKEKKLISPAKIIDHVQNGFSKVDADAGENTHTLISLIDKEKLELSWAGNGALGCIIRNGTATDFNNIDSTSKTFALLPDDIVVCHANLHNLYATYVQKLVADNYGKPLTELKKIVTDFLENSGNEEIYLHDILIGAIKI